MDIRKKNETPEGPWNFVESPKFFGKFRTVESVQVNSGSFQFTKIERQAKLMSEYDVRVLGMPPKLSLKCIKA